MRKRRTGRDDRLARRFPPITVFSSPSERRRGLLRCGQLVFPCALGRTGVTHFKREGDGATPAGRYRLLSLYMRPDRGVRPRTALPLLVMRKNDGWCEDARHGRYNCPIRLPSSAGHETMWRDDRLYDLVGILDWNFSPRVRGRGSAIFLHLCREELRPTAGCIALRLGDLRLLLANSGPGTEIIVAAKPRKRRAPPRDRCRVAGLRRS